MPAKKTWEPYVPPNDIPLGAHRPACSCLNGSDMADPRCRRCFGWAADWAALFAYIGSRRRTS